MRRGIHCQKKFAHKKWHKKIVLQGENTPSAIPHYFLMVHPLTAGTSNPLSRRAYVQTVTQTMKSFFPAGKQHSNKHTNKEDVSFARLTEWHIIFRQWCVILGYRLLVNWFRLINCWSESLGIDRSTAFLMIVMVEFANANARDWGGHWRLCISHLLNAWRFRAPADTGDNNRRKTRDVIRYAGFRKSEHISLSKLLGLRLSSLDSLFHHQVKVLLRSERMLPWKLTKVRALLITMSSCT